MTVTIAANAGHSPSIPDIRSPQETKTQADSGEAVGGGAGEGRCPQGCEQPGAPAGQPSRTVPRPHRGTARCSHKEHTALTEVDTNKFQKADQ